MTAPMVRIVLPTPLRQLARVNGELRLGVAEPVTQRTILDAVEASYPMLRGTLRDYVTHRRRDFVRFYACEEDWSNASPDDALPEEVAQGKEPFLVVGALSGG
jgi:sulfur-carrier protein